MVYNNSSFSWSSWLKKTGLGITLAALVAGCGASTNEETPTSSETPTSTAAPAAPCYPITAAIPVSGSSVYIDWANIRGGAIPSGTDNPYAGQSFGTMSIGGSGAGGQYASQGVDGVVSLTITPAIDIYSNSSYSTSSSTSTTANVDGYVQISTVTQQDILYTYGSQYGKTDLSQICVSAVAIEGGHYYYTLYDLEVFLYFDYTTHGYALYF